MQEMRGKVAIITGASSGIGKATAIKFAVEGAQVALVARRSELLAELTNEIQSSGGTCRAIVADVTKE